MITEVLPHSQLPHIKDAVPAHGQRTARRHRNRDQILKLQLKPNKELQYMLMHHLSSIFIDHLADSDTLKPDSDLSPKVEIQDETKIDTLTKFTQVIQ